MEKVSPTRMNLLIKKDQIAIASEGLELLRSKRESLVKEFFAIMDAVLFRISSHGWMERRRLPLMPLLVRGIF